MTDEGIALDVLRNKLQYAEEDLRAWHEGEFDNFTLEEMEGDVAFLRDRLATVERLRMAEYR